VTEWDLPDANRLGRQTTWTLKGFSNGSGPMPLPQHEGKELDFRTRPVEDSDGPRTWENRRFIAAMRWGRARRIVRERVRGVFRKDDNA